MFKIIKELSRLVSTIRLFKAMSIEEEEMPSEMTFGFLKTGGQREEIEVPFTFSVIREESRSIIYTSDQIWICSQVSTTIPRHFANQTIQQLPALITQRERERESPMLLNNGQWLQEYYLKIGSTSHFDTEISSLLACEQESDGIHSHQMISRFLTLPR